MTVEPLVRWASRVVLLDDADRVLLMHLRDPADPRAAPCWLTPGGGAVAGESAEQAAIRELAEETGLTLGLSGLSAPLFTEEVEFAFDGRWYRQHNVFFGARTRGFSIDTTGWDDLERRSVDELRWWSLEELENTEEVYYPMSLPHLVRRILARQGCRC